MKKKGLEFLFFRGFFNLVLLTLTMSINTAEGQTNVEDEKEKLLISFNGLLSPEQLGLHKNDQIDWVLRNDKNELMADESIGSIFSYQFDQPGNYSLSVLNVHGEKDHVCSHHGFSGNWLVVVSPIRVTFDINAITFSKRLTSEGIVSGTEFSIPVEVNFYNQQKIEFPISMLNIKFQGVDCEVNTQAKNPTFQLDEGKHILQYSAIGKARKQSYIMIDCVDHNGNITTYYHLDEL